ncbi:unnamed protein product, partial [Didymodactylos carnosus]
MDENGSLYVVDYGKDGVRRYRRGESQGIVVAGGNGSETRLDQVYDPQYVFVDRDHSVYVSDWGNDRVMKWVEWLHVGFDIGLSELLSTSFQCKNNRSARDAPNVVEDLIKKDLKQNYMIDPLVKPPFDIYRISPMGVAY